MNGRLLVAFSWFAFASTSLAQMDTAKEVQKQNVQGNVVDAKTGQPIRKVQLEISGGAGQSFGEYRATTAPDGSFIIENVHPGRYNAVLEHAGFVRRQATFIVQPGQSLNGLVLKMQAAGVISGKILDSDGDPMARVSVHAASVSAKPGTGGYGETNDLGEYRIGDLRPGKYLVSATPPRRPAPEPVPESGEAKRQLLYATTFYPATVEKRQALSVEVHAGEESSASFRVLTVHGYRVSGSVLGVPSGPMTRIFLTSLEGGEGPQTPDQLKEGNRFEYENVLPGTYEVFLFAVKGMNDSGQPDVHMLRLSPTIIVENADVEGLQLHVEVGGRIRGVFRLDTGEKFDWTQLHVSLLPVEETPPEFGHTGVDAHSAVSSDGTFELKDVPAGSYQLAVGARTDKLRDYFTKSVIYGGRDVADSGFETTEEVFLDVVVSAKGATLEGNVVGSDGQPVPYCTVVVVPDSDRRARTDAYQQVQTDEHGYFLARGLNPGKYVVVAFEQLQEDFRQPEFLKTYKGKGETIELSEGARKSVTPKIILDDAELR
jgi:carboxypeptidase family protein